MAKGTKKIDDLAELLERTGGDAQRLEVVRRTQRFKRSWIELAEALIKVRASRSYERWGYTDFYAYCTQELTLKKLTVDKLTVSYSTIERHAPEVLEWDGVAKTIPSVEAIDYFSRAVGDGPANDDEPPEGKSARPAGRPAELVQELRSAVFDEGQAVGELRKRFDPILNPRPKGAETLDLLNKASAAARKLAELLPDIEGLSDKRVRRLEEELGALRDDIEALAEPLRDKLARASKRAAPPRIHAAQSV